MESSTYEIDNARGQNPGVFHIRLRDRRTVPTIKLCQLV